MDINADYIQLPLVFATYAANKATLIKDNNYIYLWDSPLDGLPLFLIKDVDKMNHSLIKRMYNPNDHRGNSIVDDIVNHIKESGILE